MDYRARLGQRGGPGARSHGTLWARDEGSGVARVKGAAEGLRTGRRHDLSSPVFVRSLWLSQGERTESRRAEARLYGSSR